MSKRAARTKAAVRNPYPLGAHELQRIAYDQGRRDRAAGRPKSPCVRASLPVYLAYVHGYDGDLPLRYPSGQLHWTTGGRR